MGTAPGTVRLLRIWTARESRSTSACLTICTNTGTYIDVPFHRYADGHDLADLAARAGDGPSLQCFLDRRDLESIHADR